MGIKRRASRLRSGLRGRAFLAASLALAASAAGALDLGVSRVTLEAPRDLSVVIDGWQAGRGLEIPHIVLLNEGQVFTSVSLVLRKRTTHPGVENSWAAPTPMLREKVRREAEATAGKVLCALQGRTEVRSETAETSPAVLLDDGAQPSLVEAFDSWDAVRARTALTVASTGPTWRRGSAFASRTLRRLRDLGIIWDRERDVLRALVAKIDALESRVERLSRRDRT